MSPIKELRERLGMHQDQFAREVGVSIGTISRNETREPRGQWALPFLAVARRYGHTDIAARITELCRSEMPESMWHLLGESKADAVVNTEEETWVEMLLRILRSGNRTAIDVTKRSLPVFLTMCERGGPSNDAANHSHAPKPGLVPGRRGSEPDPIAGIHTISPGGLPGSAVGIPTETPRSGGPERGGKRRRA